MADEFRGFKDRKVYFCSTFELPLVFWSLINEAQGPQDITDPAQSAALWTGIPKPLYRRLAGPWTVPNALLASTGSSGLSACTAYVGTVANSTPVMQQETLVSQAIHLQSTVQTRHFRSICILEESCLFPTKSLQDEVSPLRSPPWDHLQQQVNSLQILKEVDYLREHAKHWLLREAV